MREIVFLAHRIPYPPDRGDKIRSWHLLRHLAGLARVHLGCFADDETDAAHLDSLRSLLGERLGETHVEVRRASRVGAGLRALLGGKPVSLTLFDSPAMRNFVERRLADRRLGAVVAFSGQMAQFVPTECDTRFVMDLGDVDSAKFEQYALGGSLPMRWVHRREARLLSRFERATAKRADITTFVSAAEAALFAARSGIKGVALSNGIDLACFDPAGDFEPLGAVEPGAEPILLFTGQMDYPPNVDAVLWFAREVMPRLDRGRFVIAGRNPVAEVAALAGPRVMVTGPVSDMRSWLAAAAVVVAPLRIARGIQNKVLEAMAMARPVVASPAAFEGIEAVEGRDLVVADGAGAMADAIVRLLGDRGEAEAIGAAGRRCVERTYGWQGRLEPLGGLVFPQPRRAAA